MLVFRLMFAVAQLFVMATLGRAFESGGGDSGDDGDDRDRRPKTSDILAQYGGDALRMSERLQELMSENYGYREKNRGLKAQVETLTAKQIPEGGIVLAGDEAQAWETFKTLGKPDEVQQKLGQVDTLQGQLATMQKEAVLGEAAQLAGYKVSVLKDRAQGIDIEVREVTEDGKTVKRAFVKAEGGDKPLTEYAEQQWTDYLPALKAAGQGTTAQHGVTYPAQGSTTTQGAPDAVAAFIAQRNERAGKAPNPLAAKSA